MQTIDLNVAENSFAADLDVAQAQAVELTSEEVRVIEAVSPTVNVERVDGGVEITVHDLRGDHVAALYDGQTGATGETGAAGPQGPKGDKGDTGERGAQGETGAKGPKGDKGDKGDTGATGPQGAQGERGQQGETGPKGDQGQKGDTGEKGDKGDPGDDYVLTAADKAEIAALVLAELPVAEGVSF
jgi:hypothetical protein